MTNHTPFRKFPKGLDRDVRFRDMRAEEKLAYMGLLDMYSLSMKNAARFTDEEGVYVIFTNRRMQEFLSCGHDKATRIFRRLAERGLIRYVRQCRGRCARIYVRDVFGVFGEPQEAFTNRAGLSGTTSPLVLKTAPTRPETSARECGFSAPIKNDITKTDSDKNDSKKNHTVFRDTERGPGGGDPVSSGESFDYDSFYRNLMTPFGK